MTEVEFPEKAVTSCTGPLGAEYEADIYTLNTHSVLTSLARISWLRRMIASIKGSVYKCRAAKIFILIITRTLLRTYVCSYTSEYTIFSFSAIIECEHIDKPAVKVLCETGLL